MAHTVLAEPVDLAMSTTSDSGQLGTKRRGQTDTHLAQSRVPVVRARILHSWQRFLVSARSGGAMRPSRERVQRPRRSAAISFLLARTPSSNLSSWVLRRWFLPDLGSSSSEDASGTDPGSVPISVVAGSTVFQAVEGAAEVGLDAVTMP